MPISHISKQFAIDDAKIAKVTADPVGGTTTYATVVDVPGVKAMVSAVELQEKQLRGDNTLLDIDVSYVRATGTLTFAKVNLDMDAVLLGATVTDSGTTPNMLATLGLKSSDRPNYFKIEGRTPVGGADTVTGDLHVVLYKCKITGYSGFGFAEEDYSTFSVPFAAIGRASDSKWFDRVLNETAVAIS